MTPKKMLTIASGIAIVVLVVLVTRNMLSLSKTSAGTQEMYKEIQADGL